MTPEELSGYLDELGPTLVAVVLLAMFVIPALWKMRGGDATKDAVEDAMLRRDVADLRKLVDDHEERLEALEKKPRSRS